jgi:hypothetical protein
MLSPLGTKPEPVHIVHIEVHITLDVAVRKLLNIKNECTLCTLGASSKSSHWQLCWMLLGSRLPATDHWRLHCSTREHFGMRCIPVHFALPLRTSQRSAHRFWQLRSITRMPCFWVVLGWTQPASEVRRTTAARAGIFIGQLAKLYRCSGRGVCVLLIKFQKPVPERLLPSQLRRS